MAGEGSNEVYFIKSKSDECTPSVGIIGCLYHCYQYCRQLLILIVLLKSSSKNAHFIIILSNSSLLDSSTNRNPF